MKYLYTHAYVLVTFLLSLQPLSNEIKAQEYSLERDTLAYQEYLSAEKIGRCVDVSLLFQLNESLKVKSVSKLLYSGSITRSFGHDHVHPETPVYEWGYMCSPFEWKMDNERFPNAVRYELLSQVRAYRRLYDRESELKAQLVAALSAFDSVANNRPLFFHTIYTDYGGNIEKYVSYLLRKSILFNPLRMTFFTRKPSNKRLQRDLGVQFVIGLALYESWIRDVREGRLTETVAPQN